VTSKYDPIGRRIEKISPIAGTTIYAYDGDNIVEELDGSGSATARYTQGLGIDEPMEVQVGHGSYYYSADGLGSVVALTKSNGSAVNTYFGYNTFGGMPAPTETVANPFRFTGREWDSETSLYYYRARYYDSLFGRFLSEDPIGLGGRDENLYRYVRGNPASFGDPSGLLTVDKNFPSDCLPSLQRALSLVRRTAKKDSRCNCMFTRIGDHRSLQELVEDPRIAVHYDAKQEHSSEGETIEYTKVGDKHNIWIQPLGCRLGRWVLASALVHELTHITLTPGPGQEELAGWAQLYCGFKIYVVARPTVITVHP
jgi:RHS repeat-associated protein